MTVLAAGFGAGALLFGAIVRGSPAAPFRGLAAEAARQADRAAAFILGEGGSDARPVRGIAATTAFDHFLNAPRKPRLRSVVAAELPIGRRVFVEGVEVLLTTHPAVIVAGEDVIFRLSIRDRDGAYLSPDITMHGTAIHAYAVRDDLRGGVSHFHHSERKNGGVYWQSGERFPVPGSWRILTQFPKDGVLYQFTTPLIVRGRAAAVRQPNFSRTASLRQYAVELQASPLVRAGEAADVRFALDYRMQITEDQRRKRPRDQHNLILARREDLFIWNHHGDGSVDDVAALAGVAIERFYSDDDPFRYNITFPEPGLWLVHFEHLGEDAEFYVYVD